MNRESIIFIATLFTVLSTAASAPLTEQSIRKVLSQRDELTRHKKYDEVSQLYTSNATIRTSYMGYENKVGAKEFFSAFTNEEENVTVQDYKTTPVSIKIAEDGQSAQIENKIQSSILMTKEHNQIITASNDESLTVTNTGSALKISSAQLKYNYVPEASELYKRVMTRLKEKGKIDKDTAIEWLKETGCYYQEGDGKSRKTVVSAKNYFTGGDDVAALAAQIPDVQVLWLNFVSDEGMKYVGQMSSLEGLLVMHSEVTDNGIASLAACTNLSILSLYSPNLTDKALETIVAFPKISSIQFRLTPENRIGLTYLARAATLQRLQLANVSPDDLKYLEKIPNLQELLINRGAINDDDLFHFENMKQLKSLSLYETQATYAGTKQLKEKRPDLYIGPDWLADPCKSSLRRIEMAKKAWARKNKKERGSLPTAEDLAPHLKAFGGWNAMKCQDGGSLSINPIGEGASCSIHGAGRASQPQPKGLSKDDFDTNGATVGRWTMDFDAAKQLATAKELPILLNFTGSDWCYWCKLMEKNVFTRPDWKTYAVENVVMVMIDFPRNQSTVPAKYKERNNALKEQYGIRGYPTFVVLSPDGSTEIARLKAGRDKTAASFIEEIKDVLSASCPIYGEAKQNRPSPKGLTREGFDLEGGIVGRWTMDIETAKKMAAEQQLPILLDFDGSDWCYWSKLMDENVFSQPEWNEYAAKNVVMVLIDFPRHHIFPDRYRGYQIRNNSLAKQYQISRVPTFILLASDGKTELARFKAGRNKTAASFIEEIKVSLGKTPPR